MIFLDAGADEGRRIHDPEMEVFFGCAPSVESSRKITVIAMTGIDPRHKPHHLSLLPSGPDEVRDRLLRGDRSV